MHRVSLKLTSEALLFRSKRGFSLLITLIFLALATVLLIGLLFTIENDRKTAKIGSSEAAVHQLADTVAQIIIGQIQQATTGGSTIAWASQPGMIRTYDNTGAEQINYKLYSSDHMTTSGALTVNGAPASGSSYVNDYDADWASYPGVYTDINSPVTDDTGVANFPILDGNNIKLLSEDFLGNAVTPSYYSYDANGDGLPDVNGFAINASQVPNYNAANPPSPSNTPVPMPVKWLYQLRNGTLIAPDAPASPSTVTFANTPAANQPTASNPIVGRIAFWTDDETSKININTACGDQWPQTAAQIAAEQIPTTTDPATTQYTPPGAFWDTPRCCTYYEHDNLGKYQPAENEFQRYPGHPATVYLAAVFPGLTRDQLFSIVPRINGGGSEGGTMVAPGAVTPDSDRLYASVDELLFNPTKTGNLRGLNDGTATILNKSTLKEANFFLTANSRAPEVNLFGQPRIAIWPIDQDVVAKAGGTTPSPRGTAFDRLIAFCAHFGAPTSGKDYFFQRSSGGYASPTQDYNLTAVDGTRRNQILYSYLQKLVGGNIPGFGGSLAAKFGTDTNQILTEIFDYIRCTNLSDDGLAFSGVASPATYFGIPPGSANAYTPAYAVAYWKIPGSSQYTYKAYPQPDTAWVAPAQIGTTQGFGRFATLSEAGILVICTADGTSTSANPNWTGVAKTGDGGLTALNSSSALFYSDFPPLQTPLPNAAQIAANPFFENAPGYKTTSSPGYNSANWNYTLPTYNWSVDNASGNITWTGLNPGQKRIQAMFIAEPFDVAEGKKDPGADFQFRVQNLDQITINGTSLGFPADGYLKYSNSQPALPTGTSGPTVPANAPNIGLGHTGLFGWRTFLTSNSAWGANILNGAYASTDTVSSLVSPVYTANDMGTYPFVSQCVTITGAITMAFRAPAATPVIVSIYDGAGLGSATPANAPVQTIDLDFSQLNTPAWPVPDLITAVQIPNGSNPGINEPESLWRLGQIGALQEATATLSATSGGRFYDLLKDTSTAFGADSSNTSYTGCALICHNSAGVTAPGDVIRTLVPGYPGSGGSGPVRGDYRILAAMPKVPSSVFIPHALASSTANKRAHSFNDPSGYIGTINADTDTNGRLIPVSSMGVEGTVKSPDGPVSPSTDTTLLPYVTGDFDNGIGSCFDGPFINKPDEGDQFSQTAASALTSYYGYPYFGAASYLEAGYLPGFFSPNRQIPSPGMFGSLPTGVIRGQPWQTLLFRPQPGHPDGVPVPDATTSSPPYGKSVADHLIMDLFWMPVVEPYALSETFSTAGKINLNYQIAPFTYITRATAVDALLKSQRILAIPTSASALYKNTGMVGYAGTALDYRYDLNLSPVNGTLRQFQSVFSSGDLFRAASQICDIYLTPVGQSWTANAQATAFWSTHSLTGDNSRERPYANLYGCLTTKSNTFTVHFRVQTLQKIPGTPVNQWIEGSDVITSEYRGSSLIERYIDPSSSNLPDFATTYGTSAATTLDSYYKFRVLSTKKFAP